MKGRSPTSADRLQASLVFAEADARFTEAVLHLQDQSRLCFRHAVGERWAKSVGPQGREAEAGLAEELLPAIAHFRLNAKHLDIQFHDGSRWEETVKG